MSLELQGRDRRRDRWRMGVTMFVVVVFVSSSCHREENRSDVYFPTWTREPGAAVPTGILPGRLVERNGCLLWSDETDVVPLWPDNFQLDDPNDTIAADSGIVLAVGDGGTLGGGERTLEQAESVIGEAIPSRCQPSGGYWLVTEVMTE